MNSNLLDVLRPMLEDFVRSVVQSKIKSRDLYKYAHEYFISMKTNEDDVMDDETEEQMRLAFDQLDDEETRRRTRPTLFGNSFNPEIEQIQLGKTIEEKSVEEHHFLQQSLRKTIPFRVLDADQIEEIIEYFQFYPVKSGEMIFKENDEGDYFYLVQTGRFEALIDNKQVKIYENEGSFGELALLYDQPRLATIRALTDGKLWRMNREMFSKVTRFVAFEKRRYHLEILQHCQILENMTRKEMLDVADALKCEEYQRGDTIIHEGDAADAMYFVETGNVEIRIRQTSKSSEYFVVKICQTGDYFGERALLYNERRAATAVAMSHCQLLVLDRADFDRLLGSAKSVLKRKAENYKSIVRDIENKHL